MDRTHGELDAAVLADREAPSEETRQRVLDAAEAHNAAFLRELTGEYIDRTRGGA